ncbi:RING-H2 finger protein ATL12 [Musa troglodytarum]|uniref:RING-type E3 ubiquitin transferase n=1 Tax=Musa troglodytarum TaxID=320322 RepID=A0A9E7FF91_9LILI|nr:RING-H2 finger protein ATL12 [Musa troglodytarum]
MPSLENTPFSLRFFFFLVLLSPATVASAQHAYAEYSPSETAKVSFGPSVAIAIGVFSAMLSLTVLLLVYVKCRRSMPSESIIPAPTRQTRHQLSGIDRTVVESLPFFRFASLRGVRDGLECAVCISKFNGDEVLRLLPKCKHAFHIDCVDRWLEVHSSCPLCRCKVVAGDVARFAYSTSSRFLFPSGRHETSGRELELFVEREPNHDAGHRGSSRFGIGSSFRKMDRRTKEKEKVPILEEATGGDQFLRKFKHRIVVSDNVFKGRWSALNSSDLASLNSEMLSITSSERFALLGLNVQTTGEEKIFVDGKETTEEKSLLEAKVNQIGAPTSATNPNIPSPSNDNGNLISPASKASISSMSDITNLSRSRQERDPGNSTTSRDEDEKLRRLWLPIARRTVQCFAGRRDSRPSTAIENSNV